MTGHLNLAAMSLSQIPPEVMNMYDSTKALVSWFEMVDLSKADFSGNELTQISDTIFPDWSIKEMEDDEEKTNQFAGLETLFLQHNRLTTIPVGLRRMEQLRTLNLSGNNISMTNQLLNIVWQIPQLQNLSLAKCSLRGAVNLSTMGTEQLRSLDLSDNELTEVDLAEGQMATLQSLVLSSNQLESIPWTALAQCALVDLKVASNKLSGTAFARVDGGFDKLKDLDISHNDFSDLGPAFCALASLQSCSISGNSIRSVPDMSGLRSLTTFLAASNKLEHIPESLHSLSTKLKHVDLSNNAIKTVQPELAAMDELTSLNLDGNPLRQRNLLTMSTTELKVHMQKRLDDQPSVFSDDQAEHIAKAPMRSATQPLYKIVNGVLDLSNRSLTSVSPSSIDFASKAQVVHTLRLSNNDLSALPTELLQHPSIANHLQSLDISHNAKLHSSNYLTSRLCLPALRSLYVVSTGLTALDAFTANLVAPELIELNISCHRISGPIPNIRAYFPKCRLLLASDNWFSSVTAEDIRGLEVLDIRNNQIDSLPVDIGLLGNHDDRQEPGRLRSLEVAGNPFRVPRIAVVEKGTEAVLKDLRRRVPTSEVPAEWEEEIQ
ncbi:Leucine-rich repeat-containing protein 40 [Cyphellophora attinorum]|uniref:Leucine-rich repeat-containing protein 40 n=1 Tax=Cyphellophora attinorum TaxID=1664694 RepID=A0A0N1HSG0_9EURO|nr:Leucine-rich repeat-containing protein 40 [Phialophora attinorum]KPI39103.1 Leucine-rich repeat-containing protein 40 [Phialophora attinorum]